MTMNITVTLYLPLRPTLDPIRTHPTIYDPTSPTQSAVDVSSIVASYGGLCGREFNLSH